MRRRGFLVGSCALALSGCAAPLTRNIAGDGERRSAALSRIAFASCIDQTQPQPIWDAVLAARPELMLFGGDNVYASTQPWRLQALEAAYARQTAVPGFARLRAAAPHLAIWDDHDYGLNDGGAEFAHKDASKAAFLRFWGIPANDERHRREGLYHAQRFGPPGQRVQIILLDTRWHRSPLKPTDARNQPGRERYLPDDDPAKTFLGAEQWQWLQRQLRKPAELRLVVSGIQVVVEGHGWERWGNFPHERERLYRLIAQTRAQGVVFLSGDRHIGALYQAPTAGPYPFYEMTSSGATHPWREAAEAGPNRLGPLLTEHHFGTIEIDWAAQGLQLALRDAQGQTRQVRAISLAQLKL